MNYLNIVSFLSQRNLIFLHDLNIHFLKKEIDIKDI